ncbi:MAG: hypothetical protein ACXQTM_07710 [Methanosarcinales archaeon]
MQSDKTYGYKELSEIQLGNLTKDLKTIISDKIFLTSKCNFTSMGRKPEKEAVKWLTLEELNEEIRSRKVYAEVLRRLFFVKELYKGAAVLKAAKEVGVSKVIGYV